MKLRIALFAFLASFGSILGVACGGDDSTAAPSTDGGGGGDVTQTDGGSGDGANVDGASSDASSEVGYPAPHPAAPQIINASGDAGPVLAHPHITSVFFANDDSTMVGKIGMFTTALVASSYAGSASEYGVGAPTASGNIGLTDTPTGTIDDSAIQMLIAGKLNANDPAWPTADANTLIVLYYPANVTITLQSQQSCTAFGSYHSQVALDSAHQNRQVAYVVVPRCGDVGNLTGIDVISAAASNSIFAATADPYPFTTPAYGQYDDDHVVWTFAFGGAEIGSACSFLPDAFQKFPDLPYTVQRVWSNLAASQGHDFCVPASATAANFNSVPVLNDSVTIQGVTTKGVKIAAGQSKTIEVDLFSDGPTLGAWTVDALDYRKLMGGTADLTFSFDRTMGKNGDKLMLTITVANARATGSPFILSSKLGTTTHYWAGLVTQ